MSRPRMLVFGMVALLSFLLSTSASATLFSSEGHGWWWDGSDAAAIGRGGTSVAVLGYGVTGATNPAVIAGTDLSYGHISYGAEVWNVKGDEGTFRQRADLLPQFGGVIVLPYGLRVGGVLRVQTDASYERERVVEEGDGYTVRTSGKGGWNRLQLLAAGSLMGRHVIWGLGLARVQGSVREDWTYDFEGSGTRDVRQVIEGRLKGGWITSAGLLLGPLDRLALAFVGSTGGSSRFVQETENLAGGTFASSLSGRQELPPELAFGVRVGPIRHMTLSAERSQTSWGDAGLRISSDAPLTHPYDDASRLGIGLEYSKGAGDDFARTYRIGFQDVVSYLRDAEGSEIGERALTLGFREPMGKRRAAFDLALEFGKRGDIAQLGIEETFLRITVGVIFSSTIREY